MATTEITVEDFVRGMSDTSIPNIAARAAKVLNLDTTRPAWVARFGDCDNPCVRILEELAPAADDDAWAANGYYSNSQRYPSSLSDELRALRKARLIATYRVSKYTTGVEITAGGLRFLKTATKAQRDNLCRAEVDALRDAVPVVNTKRIARARRVARRQGLTLSWDRKSKPGKNAWRVMPIRDGGNPEFENAIRHLEPDYSGTGPMSLDDVEKHLGIAS